MNGIIVIDKPSDCTSFDVVAKMRRLCKTKKVGHAGTLDPLATGVLPILIGSATKFQELLQSSDKEYFATFKLGVTTDTEDITGKILSQTTVNVSLTDIKQVLQSFIGDIQQVPPMYSAIKKGGKKLYEIARLGETIEREPRTVTINFIKFVDFDESEHLVKIVVSCSKGTYIRTLCADIGQKLGCGATLTELRRTKACSFALADCVALTDLENLSYDELLTKVIPIQNALNYRKIFITFEQAQRFRNGVALPLKTITLPELRDEELVKVFSDDNFVGLGMVNLQDNKLKIFKLMS